MVRDKIVVAPGEPAVRRSELTTEGLERHLDWLRRMGASDRRLKDRERELRAASRTLRTG